MEKHFRLKYRGYLDNHDFDTIPDRWEIEEIVELDHDPGDSYNEYDGYAEWVEIYDDKKEAEENIQDMIEDHKNVTILSSEQREQTETENKTKDEIKKIKVHLTHRAAIEEIISLIDKYMSPPHCPGTDHAWRIGINENGEPDATCDGLQDHYGAVTIPVVFYDTTASEPFSLEADDEMSVEEKNDWYVEEFMSKTPNGFELLKFILDQS